MPRFRNVLLPFPASSSGRRYRRRYGRPARLQIYGSDALECSSSPLGTNDEDEVRDTDVGNLGLTASATDQNHTVQPMQHSASSGDVDEEVLEGPSVTRRHRISTENRKTRVNDTIGCSLITPSPLVDPPYALSHLSTRRPLRNSYRTDGTGRANASSSLSSPPSVSCRANRRKSRRKGENHVDEDAGSNKNSSPLKNLVVESDSVGRDSNSSRSLLPSPNRTSGLALRGRKTLSRKKKNLPLPVCKRITAQERLKSSHTVMKLRSEGDSGGTFQPSTHRVVAFKPRRSPRSTRSVRDGYVRGSLRTRGQSQSPCQATNNVNAKLSPRKVSRRVSDARDGDSSRHPLPATPSLNSSSVGAGKSPLRKTRSQDGDKRLRLPAQHPLSPSQVICGRTTILLKRDRCTKEEDSNGTLRPCPSAASAGQMSTRMRRRGGVKDDCNNKRGLPASHQRPQITKAPGRRWPRTRKMRSGVAECPVRPAIKSKRQSSLKRKIHGDENEVDSRGIKKKLRVAHVAKEKIKMGVEDKSEPGDKDLSNKSLGVSRAKRKKKKSSSRSSWSQNTGPASRWTHRRLRRRILHNHGVGEGRTAARRLGYPVSSHNAVSRPTRLCLWRATSLQP